MKKSTLALAILPWFIVGVLFVPGVMAQSVDVHNVNAQVYGNETATNGFPAYLNNLSQTGKMPQTMWLVVRAPGENSTFTLAINHTVVIQNQKFSTGIANYSFNTTYLGEVPIQITVYSSAMNLTRVFTYHPDIMTVEGFITYEQYIHPKRANDITTFGAAFVYIGFPTALGVTSMILFAEYWRKEKNSNPDFGNFLIGGTGGMQ